MLLVTGATGKVGSAVLAELANRSSNQSQRVRALVRDPGKLTVKAPNIEVVVGDFGDPASLDKALLGVDAAFLASAFDPKMTELQMNFVEAAKRAKLPRVVLLSGIGANARQCCVRTLRWHGQVETSLQAAGIQTTSLRAAFFFQNLLKQGITKDGVIAGPFRNSKWPWIDARDVGAAAAATLTDTKHAGQTYTLTAPELLSYNEVADRLTAVLQTPIKYLDISANETRGRLRAEGGSPVLIEAKLELWDAFASGYIKVEPNQLIKEITGRDARTLEEFARDYRSRFLKAA
jgi:uncharacterized protein YbjT (DUF2867 family)